MELIKLKLLDTDGMTLLTAPAAGQVSLVYMNAYKPGDRVSLEIGTPGQYVVIQFEDTMAPALVYVVKREINFHIPFGEQAITYSPKSFAGACHIIRARFATPEEIAARLEKGRSEIEMALDYDYIVVNDEVETAARRLGEIIRSARWSKKFNQSFIQEVLNNA